MYCTRSAGFLGAVTVLPTFLQYVRTRGAAGRNSYSRLYSVEELLCLRDGRLSLSVTLSIRYVTNADASRFIPLPRVSHP